MPYLFGCALQAQRWGETRWPWCRPWGKNSSLVNRVTQALENLMYGGSQHRACLSEALWLEVIAATKPFSKSGT